MAFFKKLTPARGDDKGNDTRDASPQQPKQAPPPGGARPQTQAPVVNEEESAALSVVSSLRKLTGQLDKQAAAPITQRPAVNPHAPAAEQAAPTRTPAPQAPRQQTTMPHEEARSTRRESILPAEEAASKLGMMGAENLPDLGDVTQGSDMLQLLSDQAGLKFVRLGDFPKSSITPQLLSLISDDVARSYNVFPVELREDGTLVVAISDPLNVRIVDDLRLLLHDKKVRDVEAVVANEEEVVDYINLFYGIGKDTLDTMVEVFNAEDTSSGLETPEGSIDLSDLNKIAEQEPIVRFCNLLLLQAVRDRASDLHIEPFSASLRLRYRVDGVLREIQGPPKSWLIGIVSRFKVMAGLDISETRRPQDGRLKLTIEGREIDMRISTLPVAHGECIVMRLLDKSMMMVGVGQIGMTPDVLEKFMKVIERPNGILLVTGPTGSGKTTTLYAALNEINDPSEKIITTEDPVEYQLDGVVQIMINDNVGLTFAACLRAILRQDPDVILVGEIRDTETAQIAIQASLTGHLVFSTLHTNSAAGTITRLIDMGVEPFLITSTLEGIIAQRLVRMICPQCKKPYQPLDEELADFGTTREEVADITFFKGEGCDECSHSGYKGRIGIFELMEINDDVRQLILDRASTDLIHAQSIKDGMKTLRQDGWLKICLGVTTFEEVARHTPRENAEQIREEMEKLLAITGSGKTDNDDAKTSAPMAAVSSSPPPPQQAPQPARPTPYAAEAAARTHDVGDAQPVNIPGAQPRG